MAPHTLALFSLEGVLNQATLQELLETWGYGVIFLAMLLENAGVPLPGETVTLLGGYAAGSGHLNVLGVMAAATRMKPEPQLKLPEISCGGLAVAAAAWAAL